MSFLKKIKNIISVILKAMFYEHKTNGFSISMKKLIALPICFLAVYEKFVLVFNPARHFTTLLLQAVPGIDPVIVTALIVSLDGLAILALTVYGVAKAKGAA